MSDLDEDMMQSWYEATIQVEELTAYNKTQAQEILELKAYVNELFVNINRGYDLITIIRRASDSGDGGIDQLQHINDEAYRAIEALTIIKTPAQSLQAHNAAIEDEVMERISSKILEWSQGNSYQLIKAAEEIPTLPRKYKEPEG